MTKQEEVDAAYVTISEALGSEGKSILEIGTVTIPSTDISHGNEY